MYMISPWSRGGWVNSQVFDHTSVIRFLEARFGVMEPNISPWRRAVCGDLTSAFDFKTPNAPFPKDLPETRATAARAAALPGRTAPKTPPAPLTPVQETGPRLSRALPYVLDVEASAGDGALELTFANLGKATAVFHVYDRLHLDRAPRRYTVEAGRSLKGVWDAGAYDLWVLGPAGFHRHFIGDAAKAEPRVRVAYAAAANILTLSLDNPGRAAARLSVTPNAYETALQSWTVELAAGARVTHRWPLTASRGWYDLSVRLQDKGGYLRRLAGRLETGADSITDPAAGGPAVLDQVPLA